MSAAAMAVLTVSCSLNKVAVDMVANTLASGGTAGNAFTSDDDPELVGQALPFALKLSESLLDEDPTNAKLCLETGSLFVMYANAFVQGPASMLPDNQYQEQQTQYERAKRLYLRGRDYTLRGLDLRLPGFSAALSTQDALEKELASATKEDVPFLFWAAAGWMGAYAVNPLDFTLSVTIQRPLAMMARAATLDNSYGDGQIPEFYVSYDAAAPESLGGGLAKAHEAYQEALLLSQGKRPSLFVAYAENIAVREHNEADFKQMLGRALAIDPNVDPANRLATVIAQKRAQWLLDHVDDYFLEP